MRTLLLALSLLCLAPSALAQAPDTALIARAEAGDADAALETAIAYLDGNDVANATRFATMAADSGDAEGMNMMAILLQETDPVASRSWEDRAIVAGSAAAKINRATRMISEDTSDTAWTSALALIQSADHAQAAALLNDMTLEYARLRAATPQRVFQLTQIAAERGSAEAQWRHAMNLREGIGGPRDVPAAYQWTRRSAEAGYTDGMISTAVMLATGEGVAENDLESRQWYQRAADQGSVHALRGLGFMLLFGEGGPPDVPHGWAYITIAADSGDEVAARYRPELEPRIPDDAKREAELIRNAWLTAHPAL
jgi:TPR repeat protein